MNMRVMVMVIFCCAGLALGRDVVFIGLSGDAAPAVEQSFDKLLREKLSSEPDVNVTDYLECQRYKRLINFTDYPVVSRELVESLIKFTSDTTLFVWGSIKNYQLTPVRKGWFHKGIKGELDIALSMYSLEDHEYAYAGDISVTTYKGKGGILFDDVSEVVHISAMDRADMLDALESEAVGKSRQMVSAVIRSEIDKAKENGMDMERYKVPSLQELFHMPSMDAPTVPGTDSTKTTPKKSSVQRRSRSAPAKK